MLLSQPPLPNRHAVGSFFKEFRMGVCADECNKTGISSVVDAGDEEKIAANAAFAVPGPFSLSK